MIGKKFNLLKVINEIPKVKGQRSKLYYCRCDCGKFTTVAGTALRFGSIKSCGCLSKHNLNGKTFGKLKVKKELLERKNKHVLWLCQCECGKNVKVKSSDLVAKRKTSCGCENSLKKDLTGRNFGMLKALNSLSKRYNRYVIWQCRCKCGKLVEVSSGALLSGHVNSCGCLKHRLDRCNPKWKGFGEISGKMWGSIKRSANIRKLKFDITIEDAWKLFVVQNRKCNLSGVELTFSGSRTASLDRIDSSKGYVIGNIQWIHKDINNMKNSYEQVYFLKMCELIVKNVNGEVPS